MTRARPHARTAAACFAALLLSGVAAPALAQAQAGPQSLPRDIPAIPAPTADRFPGVIRHESGHWVLIHGLGDWTHSEKFARCIGPVGWGGVKE